MWKFTQGRYKTCNDMRLNYHLARIQGRLDNIVDGYVPTSESDYLETIGLDCKLFDFVQGILTKLPMNVGLEKNVSIHSIIHLVSPFSRILDLPKNLRAFMISALPIQCLEFDMRSKLNFNNKGQN
jgi:hypothetical protein